MRVCCVIKYIMEIFESDLLAPVDDKDDEDDIDVDIE